MTPPAGSKGVPGRVLRDVPRGGGDRQGEGGGAGGPQGKSPSTVVRGVRCCFTVHGVPTLASQQQTQFPVSSLVRVLWTLRKERLEMNSKYSIRIQN